jgi:hypothetical protein
MRRHAPTLLVLVALLLTSRASAQDAAAPVSLRIAGDVLSAREWTTAEMEKDFSAQVKPVTWTFKDSQRVSRSIPLRALVETAKLETDPARKQHDLSFVVVVRARDGSTSAFSWAELDPALRGTEAWVALDDNAQALSDRDAPAGLLVTNDGKRSRWVRGIDSIHVIDTTKVLPK